MTVHVFITNLYLNNVLDDLARIVAVQ